MFKFLKFLGGLLTGLTVLVLIIFAALVAPMDSDPAWVIGLILVLAPCVIWLIRNLRKIDW